MIRLDFFPPFFPENRLLPLAVRGGCWEQGLRCKFNRQDVQVNEYGLFVVVL